MNKTVWVVLVIGGTIAITAAILTTGGKDVVANQTEDPAGDLVITEGAGEPGLVGLADITDAEVRKDGDQVVFDVTVDAELPDKVTEGKLDFRWELSEGAGSTWLVTANLSTGPTASVTSLRTGYGASTIDDTLSGTVETNGATLTVTIDSSAVDGFPTSFSWRLTTSLDGDPADPGSATATDAAPDQGNGTLE